MKTRYLIAGAITISAILFLFNCKKDDPIPDLVVSHDTTGMTCYNCNDATISLHVTGGTQPYSFSWSNSATTQNITGLGEGIYSVIITDAAGKKAFDTISIDYTHQLVRIETDSGNILIWLYYQTPKHRTNFIQLANEHYYDSVIFHRVIDNFVIQGGDPTGTGSGGKSYTIDAEFVSTIKHDFGAVGAARDNNPEKKSHGSQFYICENQAGSHHLDNNYTVFGKVIDGMTSVSAIASVPVDANNKPLNNVYMKKVYVVNYTTKELLEQFGFSIP